MKKSASGCRAPAIVVLSLTVLLGSATRSFAADTPPSPDQSLDLPAGLACDFALHIDVWTNDNRVFKEFTDKDGNIARVLAAGRGNMLAFTNVESGAILTLKPNGSVDHTTRHPGGSETHVLTGHNVLIFFPTDVPPGPSTTLYVGRVTYDADTNGVFTFVSASGKSTDICAALP